MFQVCGDQLVNNLSPLDCSLYILVGIVHITAYSGFTVL